jgi:hypothetical protein
LTDSGSNYFSQYGGFTVDFNFDKHDYFNNVKSDGFNETNENKVD